MAWRSPRLPRAPLSLPTKLLGGLHFDCRSAFLTRGNCGRRDQRDLVQRAATAPHPSAYNSNPHGFSGPPHLLRPVGCDRPKRLGVASSCYAARTIERQVWPTPSLVHDLAGRCSWLLGLLPRCRCQSRTRPPISRMFSRSGKKRRERLETLGSGSQCLRPPWAHGSARRDRRARLGEGEAAASPAI